MDFSFQKELFGFFRLGCAYAILCRNNILYYDFHNDNTIISDSGDITIIDSDDMERVSFIENLEKYAKGIINIYSNFGMDFGAAFRYGFTCVAGEAGRVLYDIMYNNNELTCLNQITDSRKLNTQGLAEKYEKWNILIDDSFVKKVTNNTYKYREFSFIELMERNSDVYNDFKQKHKDDTSLLMHEYQTYFANAFYSENIFDFVGAALSLCQIEFFNQQYFLSAYYLVISREVMASNEDCLTSLIPDLQHATYPFVNKFGENETKQLLLYIFHEVIRLRIQKKFANPFYEIWYWYDFSREHLIDDFLSERSYGCYKCIDCNYLGFFDNELLRCESCNSDNVCQISLEEYLELKEIHSKCDEDSCENSDISDVDATDNLPKLDNVSLIPIYFETISSYEKKLNYDKAIYFAKCVEDFLKNNLDICDDRGYVVEKANRFHKIFYSTIEPKQVLKLFLNEANDVKSDYESYVNYKLCVLYEKKGEYQMAYEYAQIIIDLANNSPRWLNYKYIRKACFIIKDFLDKLDNKIESLKYANFIFIYDMLDNLDGDFKKYDKNQEIYDTIHSLLNIGNSNADAENISIAYSCYTLALRMHIHHYGCKHPNSAIIYYNLGKLMISKKMYEDAYKHFAISLMLLEKSNIKKYKNSICKLEEMISEFLKESNYDGTLSDWKNVWMNDESFSVFPEKRLKKRDSDNNDSHIIEINLKELLNEFTTFFPN